MAIALTILGVIGLLLIALTVKKLLYICQPNEVLIFSGGTSRHDSRGEVPYKPIKGGRKVRIPLFEVVDRMVLTNMAINVAVSGAFSKGGIPLNVDGVANVKIAGEEPLLGNAVERLLGKPRHEIINIAKETLEGNLRGVLAKLTPEEVNADKLAFAQQLMNEADDDLNVLGLVLDTLKIQNVSDGVGYLDSIGRISGAEVRKKATIVEAEAQADATVKDAQNRQRTELVRIDATIRTLMAQCERDVTDAKTQQAALVAEANGQIGAAVVQAKAELEVQRARIEQVRRQLEADIITPASAQMLARSQQAQGEAATIVEEGKATAEVLKRITTAWKQAGPNAREVFLMQKLQTMVGTLTRTVEGVKVDKVTVLPRSAHGNGNGGGDIAARVIGANEQIKAALGVDVVGAVSAKLSGNGAQPSAAAPSAPRAPSAPAAAPKRQTQPRQQARRPQRAAPQAPQSDSVFIEAE
ncbi:MAG: flotillin family protein [Myxococcales bacterium]|nr:flotillin family protein [Myxococcales bacterium]